ncbi:MAG: OmpA family protein [Rhizomicrobium sp.]
MRRSGILVPLLALGVAACGGPRPMVADIPAPPMRGSEAPRPPAWHKPPPPTVTGPAGPLTVARIDGYMDGLETELRRHVHGVGIVIARQGNNIDVVVQNTRLFAADGGVNGDDVLEPLAAVLRGYVHTTVQVEGFTDTAGKPEQNLAVSQKRAQRIADALAHEGVPGNRLSVQGFGETRLRVATGDDKNEPRNRRIEFLIKAKPG